jgi:cytochrome c peroxidase
MGKHLACAIVLLGLCCGAARSAEGEQESGHTLGLPPVPLVEDNPQTPEKIALGEKLFNDERFSTTGEVSCATCHATDKAFTDSPLKTSEGINKLTGTRNAPTVINALYFDSMFWDGRSPSLEDQSLHPFVNPVEMGLPDHQPILDVIRADPEYAKAFREVFGKSAGDVTMDEVTKAIASFERTIVSGDSRFDRYFYAGEEDALTPQQKRGFAVFVNQGRCVSCHVIEQTQALFTDNRFHNIGVGINAIQEDIPELAHEFLEADATLSEVDVEVLTDPRTSELGRFAVTHGFDDVGAFKTPTLRNVALTAPYMHDGSLETLRDVVVHYNNGGVTQEGDRVNDFLSGGIRPLGLTDEEIDDLVAFMEALTGSDYAHLVDQAGRANSEGGRR